MSNTLRGKPNEVISLIISQLDPESAIRFSKTCRSSYHLISCNKVYWGNFGIKKPTRDAKTEQILFVHLFSKPGLEFMQSYIEHELRSPSTFLLENHKDKLNHIERAINYFQRKDWDRGRLEIKLASESAKGRENGLLVEIYNAAMEASAREGIRRFRANIWDEGWRMIDREFEIAERDGFALNKKLYDKAIQASHQEGLWLIQTGSLKDGWQCVDLAHHKAEGKNSLLGRKAYDDAYCEAIQASYWLGIWLI